MKFDETFKKTVDSLAFGRPARGMFECSFNFRSEFPGARENVRLAAEMLTAFGHFLMEEGHRILRTTDGMREDPDLEAMEATFAGEADKAMRSDSGMVLTPKEPPATMVQPGPNLQVPGSAAETVALPRELFDDEGLLVAPSMSQEEVDRYLGERGRPAKVYAFPVKEGSPAPQIEGPAAAEAREPAG